jgi:hypothetical protein
MKRIKTEINISGEKKKRIQSHSSSPHKKRKKKKLWYRKHKKHYSTIAVISPIKKMIQNYKKKHFTNKSGEREKLFKDFTKNLSKQRTTGHKNKNFRKTTDNYYKSMSRIRDWSPISNKLSDLRKSVLKKK